MDRHESAIQSEMNLMCGRFATPGIQYAAAIDHINISLSAGVRDAGNQAPVEADTVFLSCSSTKLLTAILALQLADEGVIRLDASHREYVPESPFADGVSIAMLMSHTGGVPSPLPLGWVHTQAAHASFDEKEALRAVMRRHSKLSSAPGSRYQYSNFGYWLLGWCLEAASGESFAQLVEDRFAPRLGLAQHALSCNFPPAGRSAHGHFPKFSVATWLTRRLTAPSIWDASTRDWARCAPLTMNGPAYGGAFATARSYLAVLCDLLSASSQLLSPQGREKLFTPARDVRQRPLTATLGFRMGMLNGARFLSKPGGGPGFCGDVRVYPDRGLATAWFCNVFCFDERSIWATSSRLDTVLL